MRVVIDQHDPFVLLGREHGSLVHRRGEPPVLLVLDQDGAGPDVHAAGENFEFKSEPELLVR